MPAELGEALAARHNLLPLLDRGKLIIGVFLRTLFFPWSTDLGQCEDVSEKESAIDRGDRAACQTDVPNDSTNGFHLARRVKNTRCRYNLSSVMLGFLCANL